MRKTPSDNAAFKDGKEPQTKECMWLLEAEKIKDTDSVLEPTTKKAILQMPWL